MNKVFSLIAFLLTALSALAQQPGDTLSVTYKLHGQTRRFKTVYSREENGSMRVDWSIGRNMHLWRGSYTMSPQALASATSLSYLMPEDGNHATLPHSQTWALLSRQQFDNLLQRRSMTLDGTLWQLVDSGKTITAKASTGAKMEINNDRAFPLVLSMAGNPAEINWSTKFSQPTPSTARELIAERPERSGGIYYAYPVEIDEIPSLPADYRVSHVSHYGRHGSRWIVKEWEYDYALNSLDSAMKAGGLTPLGQDVLDRVKVIVAQGKGRAGELSPLGERQHRGIAERLYSRFPSLFADSCTIDAHSSIEPRCIMSMAAFSERLKELNPRLTVNRRATPGEMAFISWSNPRSKAENDPAAPWWNDLWQWRDSVLDPARLTATLFTAPETVGNPRKLMWVLHDLAVDVQDVEPGVELLDIFTPSELYALWTINNYKMYYLHGNNPSTHAAGPASARALLDHIIADVDSAVSGHHGSRTVTLRFGHDTALMRLLALMKIEGTDAVVNNPQDIEKRWMDFTITPMAANLQLIVATPLDSLSGQEPLVLLRHNERPVAISGLPATSGGWYPWSLLRSELLP